MEKPVEEGAALWGYHKSGPRAGILHLCGMVQKAPVNL